MTERVLVAMSGGVDSSVAAALLVEAGDEVVGATMKLWGGASDSGCCSVADVDDARRVAQQLGIVHHVFNFGDDFETHVVAPYVREHAAGRTPNPCIECNRHLKFDRFLHRATQLGFDAVATGHHARVTSDSGRWQLRRGADRAKDQSYVLSMLGQPQLSRVRFPVGDLTKADVRDRAAALGLRTAAKADSQDVCFITSTGGREAFLGERIELRPGRVVDAATGREIGQVPALELVTIGQRRGMGAAGATGVAASRSRHGMGAGGAAGSPPRPGMAGAGDVSPTPLPGQRRYAITVDTATRTVTAGTEADLLTDALVVSLLGWSWTDYPVPAGTAVSAQVSAHGTPRPAVLGADASLRWREPQNRVAPGQTVAIYDGDSVLGSAIVS
ncbi:MAG TPA: tRNA 2-thiouridine(34) synthase MnmA [Acidimicrobiales bacterium]|nr:tRNA 2-thiouridine(34) synthase MnmA [Acidimicrobiales bacterium]